MSVNSFITYFIFLPIFNTNEVIISYGLKPFNLAQKSPEIWNFIKISFFFFSSFSYLVFGNFIFDLILKHSNKFVSHVRSHDNLYSFPNNFLHLIIGKDENNNMVALPESGLYQNFLITRYDWVW